MRKFTLSVAALILSMSSFAADLNVEVNNQPEEKKVYFTFNDYSVVLPGVFNGNFTSTATLNGNDVTFSIYPMLSEVEDYTNVIYFDYIVFLPALMNGGTLPDGDYTLTCSEGYLGYDYTSTNEEPVVITFTVGNTTGIQSLEANTIAESYNLMGQKSQGINGIRVVNGKKVILK